MTTKTTPAHKMSFDFSAAVFFSGLAATASIVGAVLAVAQLAGLTEAPSLILAGVAALITVTAFHFFSKAA